MNTAPVIQGSQCGAINPASQTPTEPARAWLSTVATKMPAMMAHWLAQPRGEDKGQQLGLVADFGDGDQGGRGEECFHAQRVALRCWQCGQSLLHST
jgi:hypothetical protein